MCQLYSDGAMQDISLRNQYIYFLPCMKTQNPHLHSMTNQQVLYRLVESHFKVTLHHLCCKNCWSDQRREKCVMCMIPTRTDDRQMNISWVRCADSLCRQGGIQTVLLHPVGTWSFICGERNPLGSYLGKSDFLNCWYHFKTNISCQLHSEWENFQGRNRTD